jgi:hypothetical protein
MLLWLLLGYEEKQLNYDARSILWPWRWRELSTTAWCQCNLHTHHRQNLKLRFCFLLFASSFSQHICYDLSLIELQMHAKRQYRGKDDRSFCAVCYTTVSTVTVAWELPCLLRARKFLCYPRLNICFQCNEISCIMSKTLFSMRHLRVVT